MSAQSWMVPLLGGVVLIAFPVIVLLVRAWPRRPELSPEEAADMADAPMPV